MKHEPVTKPIIILLLAGIGFAIGLCFLLQLVPLFNGINDLILDYFIYFNGERLPNESVMVIQVDDSTVTHLGRPLPRRFYNQMMRRLAKHQVQTQAFDLYFFNPANPVDDALIAFLTDSIQHVVHSFCFENNPNLADSLDVNLAEKYAIEIQNYENFSPIKAPGVTFPHPIFRSLFPNLGAITYKDDVDGRLRRIPLVIQYEDYCYPTLSLATLQDYFRLEQPALRIESKFWGRTAILDAPNLNLRIPINSNGQVLLNFYGVLDVFQPYSFSQLLKLLTIEPYPIGIKSLLPDFKSKIALIGNTESNTDRHPSPFSAQFPGVGFHATLLSNILNNECLREWPWQANLLITLIVVLLFYLAFFYCWLRHRAAWRFWLIFFIGIIIFNLSAFFILFKVFKIWFALWQINVTVSIIFIGMIIYEKALCIKKLNQKICELEEQIFTRLANLDQIDKMIHSRTEQYKTIHYFANELRSVLRQSEVEQQDHLEKLFLSILDNQEIIKEQLLKEIDQLKIEKERVQLEKEKLEFQKNLYERWLDSDKEIHAPPAATAIEPEPTRIAHDVLLAFQYFLNQSRKGQVDRTVYQGMVALATIPNETGILQKTPMGEIFDQIKLVSMYDSTVLITGEPGTGKELVAKAIHELSGRRRKPLVTINCAAIPENLLESELFGHVRGAFTHALSDRIGAFERADGGTIFLDEIGDLKLDLQAKLLRILQEKELQKVGSNKTIQVNVRVIAATNKDLDPAVQKNIFRSDLYFRLNVVNLDLPPLRARRFDVPFLIQFFMKEFNDRYHQKKAFASEAILAGMCYDWPGNIRMLQHFVEKMGVLTSSDIIQRSMLPNEIQATYQKLFQNNIAPLWQDIESLARIECKRLMSECKDKLQIASASIEPEINPLHPDSADCYEYLCNFLQDLTTLVPNDSKEELARKLIIEMQDELFQWCRQEKIDKLSNLYKIIEKFLGRSRRQIDNWRTQTSLSEQSIGEFVS